MIAVPNDAPTKRPMMNARIVFMTDLLLPGMAPVVASMQRHFRTH
jgi:hypothetical protein